MSKGIFKIEKICLYLPVSILIVALSAFQFQTDELAASKARGKETYNEICMTCHLADGKGVPGAFPPLAGSDYITKSKEDAIRAVKFGLTGEIIVNGQKYNNAMPGQGLSDKEVADVLNYVCNTWGNKGEFISEKSVKEVKAK